MNRWRYGVIGALCCAGVLAAMLAAPRPTEASIHEIIGALCRAGGEEVRPPGQNRMGSNSFVRALQASGVITSIEVTPTNVTIRFDPTVPNSKFRSTGQDLTIPNGIAQGVSLTLSPLLVPDDDFPAHDHCKNLR